MRRFRPQIFQCPKPGCRKACRSQSGLTQHLNSAHFQPPRVGNSTQHSSRILDEHGPGTSDDTGSAAPMSDHEHDSSGDASGLAPPDVEPDDPPHLPRHTVHRHPILDGTPCDIRGNDLPECTPPPRWDHLPGFTPFASEIDFELGDFFFRELEIPNQKLDKLLHLLAAKYPDQDPPFADHAHLHSLIDSIPQGDIPWQAFTVQYAGEADGPLWKSTSYEVFFRDPLLLMEQQIGNPDYATEMDFAPKRVFDGNNKRLYTDLMSGNWAWTRAVGASWRRIAIFITHHHQDGLANDPANHGATLAPIILGSDKTTVSVATGDNEYYPLYASTGLVHNNVRRAHRNAVTLLGFLAIPKSTLSSFPVIIY